MAKHTEKAPLHEKNSKKKNKTLNEFKIQRFIFDDVLTDAKNYYH